MQPEVLHSDWSHSFSHLGFILWSLYPGVPAAAAKTAANILGISALKSQLLCEVAALQFEICVCKGSLSNNNIERGEKRRKKGFI